MCTFGLRRFAQNSFLIKYDSIGGFDVRGCVRVFATQAPTLGRICDNMRIGYEAEITYSHFPGIDWKLGTKKVLIMLLSRRTCLIQI